MSLKVASMSVCVCSNLCKDDPHLRTCHKQQFQKCHALGIQMRMLCVVCDPSTPRAITARLPAPIPCWVSTLICSKHFKSVYLLPYVANKTKFHSKELFYLTTHSTHFIYGYIASTLQRKHYKLKF